MKISGASELSSKPDELALIEGQSRKRIEIAVNGERIGDDIVVCRLNNTDFVVERRNFLGKALERIRRNGNFLIQEELRASGIPVVHLYRYPRRPGLIEIRYFNMCGRLVRHRIQNAGSQYLDPAFARSEVQHLRNGFHERTFGGLGALPSDCGFGVRAFSRGFDTGPFGCGGSDTYFFGADFTAERLAGATVLTLDRFLDIIGNLLPASYLDCQYTNLADLYIQSIL